MTRKSKKIKIGNTFIGGDSPILVQSMLNVPAEDIEGSVKQAVELEKAGCQIIRFAIPNKDALALIEPIKNAVSVPLVADMSSNILSEPYDVTRFGAIYAGAQKNMAPAGLTVAIVDRALAGHELPITPVMYSYQRMIDKDSMYNTPPCWNIYILGLVLTWLEQQGGVEGMQRLKRARAAKVYDFLDNSALFHACAQPGSRSDMNVTFRTGDDALDKEFISGAAARGLLNLKGHRVAGGMRASLYNAMPMAGVDALVDYLKQFEVEHHV